MTKKLVKNIDRLFFNSLVYRQIGVPFKNTADLRTFQFLVGCCKLSSLFSGSSTIMPAYRTNMPLPKLGTPLLTMVVLRSSALAFGLAVVLVFLP